MGKSRFGLELSCLCTDHLIDDFNERVEPNRDPQHGLDAALQ